MTKSYNIQSVDAATQTMVVVFTEDTQVTTLNVPLPPNGVTIDEQISANFPPFIIVDTSAVDAATALIGQDITPASSQIGVYKIAKNQLIGKQIIATLTAGYQSDALHPGGVEYTYPATQTDQLNMIASVTDAIRIAPDWQASHDYKAGDSVSIDAGRLLCSADGTSGSTAPSGAGTDGTVTWVEWFTPFLCADENGTLGLRPHTATQIQQAGADGKTFIQAVQIKRAIIAAEIDAAEDAASVAAITWSFP